MGEDFALGRINVVVVLVVSLFAFEYAVTLNETVRI
jgi:hypothetical protein